MRPGLRVEDAERLSPLDRRAAPYRQRLARVGVGVVPAASRWRAYRKRCFSVASASRMTEESQRIGRQLQTPPARYEAAADRGGHLKRFAPTLRLRLDS